MRNIRIYTRYRSLSPVYLNISRKEWNKYEECCNELDPLFEGDDWAEKAAEDLPRIMSLQESQEEHLVKAVTFGAMCLEAFIYDYAAHNFTDTYVKNYLDKLDVVSKWVVVVRLVTGKDFPKESKAFADLKELIKKRNDFVHSKSGPMPGDLTDHIKRYGPQMKKEVETVLHFRSISPYETVIEVLSELRKVEGENEIGSQWWQLEGSDE